MRKRILKPIAAMAVVASTLVGCASSSDSMDNTTAMEGTTMSETQTMAGDDVTMNDDNTETSTSTSTSPATALTMTNSEEIEAMFESVENTEQYDVLELARMSPNLSTFMSLLDQSGLEKNIQQLEDITLFAPTNEAFANMPQERLEMLMKPENKAQLMQFLQVHALAAKVPSAQFNSSQRISLDETGDRFIPVDVTMNGTVTTIGGAQIVKSDIEASNGVIHVVDNIITPTENGGTGVEEF